MSSDIPPPEPERKPVLWMGDSRKVVQGMPVECRAEVGFALNEAQLGGISVGTKPLVGFGGASVLEIVTSSRDGTFRVVYTVRFA